MRKYQLIWDALKVNNTLSIEADVSLHRRIIQGVIKEKWRDLGWKVICPELGNTYKLAYNVVGTKVTFTLEPYKGIRNL